jgi:hypothetical protein
MSFKDIIEVKFIPSTIHVCHPDGKENWLADFHRDETSRFVLTSLLVDFHDPILEFLPIIKRCLKPRDMTEYVFQYITPDKQGMIDMYYNIRFVSLLRSLCCIVSVALTLLESLAMLPLSLSLSLSLSL